MSSKQEFFSLFYEKGVYGKVKDISFENYIVWTDEYAPNSLDLYCPYCKDNKTFVHTSSKSSDILGDVVCEGIWYGNIRELLYKCPTCEKDLYFCFLYNGDNVIKLAQYPSLYDVSRDELKKYQKNDLIDRESFSQIYKAEVCASENYFVAAYTYMRRVYENMLLNVFTQNKSEIGITEEDYKKLRSDEKMEKIKPFLAIDEEVYKPLYSLLSEGIHSLTEEECCENYSLLKSILLDILSEQKARKEKETKRKQIRDLYSRKKSQIK